MVLYIGTWRKYYSCLKQSDLLVGWGVIQGRSAVRSWCFVTLFWFVGLAFANSSLRAALLWLLAVDRRL